MTDIVVTCGANSHTLNFADVVQEGNLAAPNQTLGGLNADVYFGTEQLPDMNKVYTNVAFALLAGESCTVAWSMVHRPGRGRHSAVSGFAHRMLGIASFCFLGHDGRALRSSLDNLFDGDVKGFEPSTPC